MIRGSPRGATEEGDLTTTANSECVPERPKAPRERFWRRGPRFAACCVLLGYLGLAAWLDAPTLVDPLHKTVAGGQQDAGIFMWFLASTSHALWAGDLVRM